VSASAFIAFSCFVPTAKAETTTEDVRRAQHLLTRAGVTPNAAGAVRFLNQLRPAKQLRETVADLIEQLGHDDSFVREEVDTTGVDR
jgi:hypothetical protein